jgi:2-polyprenyl-3-methyl-5-hydroxy-6-metoxy-1,4-benzoquinol methylase
MLSGRTVKKLLARADDFFFGKLQNQYARRLEEAVSDCESLLDVGCGSESPVKFFGKKMYCIGVDAFVPCIEKSEAAHIHNEYHMMNVMDIYPAFPKESFDAVIASDLIEHLKKEDKYKLIEIMEKIARKKVVIFTPNGFLKQRACDGNETPGSLIGMGNRRNARKRLPRFGY